MSRPSNFLPVSGLQMPSMAVESPLGKEIALHVDLEGCRGLPVTEMPTNDTARRSWFACFASISDDTTTPRVYSSAAIEGNGSLQGTVQWKESLYFTCRQFSFVAISLHLDDNTGSVLFKACVSVTEILSVPTVAIWPMCDQQLNDDCTLFLRASRSPTNEPEQTHGLHAGAEADIPAAGAWGTIFSRLPLLMKTVNELKISVDNPYDFQFWTYRTIQNSRNRQSWPKTQISVLVATLASSMNALFHLPYHLLLRRKDCVADVIARLHLLASFMDDISCDRESTALYDEAELARLVVILVTPDPTAGDNSTSSSSLRSVISRTVAKDTLIVALEAIVQSSDALPPLKSAANGLLFFTTCADMASSNKKQIRDIYRRIDGLASSLRRGAYGEDALSQAHQEIITALAQDIAILNEDLRGIVAERKSRFKQFFAAKRHHEELRDIVTQLEVAGINYMMAMATLNGATLSEVRAHVKAITLAMNVDPMHGSGSRHANAVVFPPADHVEAGPPR